MSFLFFRSVGRPRRASSLGGGYARRGGWLGLLLCWLTAGALHAALAGDLDTSFNPNADNSVVTFVPQADGKVLVGGSFTTIGGVARNQIARLNGDGSVDTSFNPTASGAVNTLVPQADGKILVGGGFTSIGGVTRNRIARLNADGSVDLGFNPNADGGVHTLVLQADGKLLVGGGFTSIGGVTRNYIARLNADGSVDVGFNPNANFDVLTLLSQADGKILLGGYFSSIGGVTRKHLARLNADGSVDASFDPNPSYYVFTLVPQADGKVLLGGTFTTIGGVPRNSIARLNADGSLDASFDPNFLGNVYTLVPQADGKLLVGGGFTSIGGVLRNRIARLNVDGSVDVGFNPNADNGVQALVLQADGKLLVGGYFSTLGGATRDRIARLVNEPATESLTVSSAGRIQWLRGGTAPEAMSVTFEVSMDAGSTWQLLSGGARIVGGWELAGQSLPVAGQVRARARVSGGQYNGSSGLVESVAAFTTPGAPVVVMAPQPVTVVVGSNATLNVMATGTGPLAYQWHQDGAAVVDATNATLSFTNTTLLQGGSYTVVITNVFGSVTSAPAMLRVGQFQSITFAPLPDKLTTSAPFALAPVASSGLPVSYTSSDTNVATVSGGLVTLNGQGTTTITARQAGDATHLPAEDVVRTLTVYVVGDAELGFNPNAGGTVNTLVSQVDGKILVVGSFTSIGGVTRNNLARLNSDGSVEDSFNPNANDIVETLVLQADGKILVGGFFSTMGGMTRNRIARLNGNGSVDTSFNPNANDIVHTLVPQADGKILVGGFFTTVGGVTRNRIARLNGDGSVDNSFNPNADGEVYTLALQADGKILVGGDFTTMGGVTRNYLARLNADGSVDASFDPNPNFRIYTFVPQVDGKILVGGNFTYIGGVIRICLVRLNADGSVDTSFNPNPNSVVYTLVPQADGKILVGGVFTTMGGMTRNRIARLNGDGSVDTSFNPNANSTVHTLVPQADGKLLVGGDFSTIGGVTRSQIARLANEPATESLTVPSAGRIQWLRGGTAPGTLGVSFEVSTDAGSTWQLLGNGTRIAGGWELAGQSLPGAGQVRARARVSTGHYNGSSGLVESVVSFTTADAPAVFTAPQPVTVLVGSNATLNVVATGTALLSYQWRLGGVEVAGATNATLNFTNTTLVQGGSYTVVITNAFGSVTSAPAVLRVGQFQSITFAPLADKLTTSAPFTLTAVASSGLPVSYTSSDTNVATVSGSTVTLRARGTTTIIASQAGDATYLPAADVSRTLHAGIPGDVDTAFNFNFNATESVSTLASQADGKILVGGYFTRIGEVTQANIARLNADGSVDLSFNPNPDSSVSTLALQADGKILVGGSFTFIGGVPRNSIARLNVDGSVDVGFAPNVGFAPSLGGTVSTLVPQADGKILVGGSFTNLGGMARTNLARLHADGSVDASFNPNANNGVLTVVPQADGKILVSGFFSSIGGVTRNNLARLNADGSVDVSFNPNANASVYATVLQADGKILVAGYFSNVGGVNRPFLARLNADGSADASFNANFGGYAFLLVPQADGKLLVGGAFGSIGGVNRPTLARLNTDGSVDASFNPDVNGTVYGLTTQADGKFLVGGSFSTIAGGPSVGIARLLNAPATESLTVPSAGRLQWLRGGTALEAQSVSFEVSTDAGSTWQLLGNGTHIAGGWELVGQNLPSVGQVRARARVTGGQYNASSGLVESVAAFTTADAPVVAAAPQPVTVLVGSNATLNVVATGTAPLSYQWRLGGVAVVSATNAALNFTNTTLLQGGSYTVVITNAFGAVTSSVAALTVEPFGMPRINVTGGISGGVNVFSDSAYVTMTTAFTNAALYYSLDGSAPFIGGPLTYSGLFMVTANTTVRVLAVNLNDFSSVPSDPVSLTIIPTYPLPLTTAGGGTVAMSPSASSYLSNSVVTVTATPDAGWTFLYWTGDTNGFTGGTGGSAGATNALTVNRKRDVQAVFGTTLSTSVAGSGAVQLSPTNGPYAYGSVVRLTPKPAVGSYFSLWGNAGSGSSNPLDFTVTTPNRIVSALFMALSGGQVNLYLDVVGNGSVTRSPALNVYTAGQTVTLTAVTPPVSRFNGWSGATNATTTVISVLLDVSKSVTASFSPVPVGTVVAWGAGKTNTGTGGEFGQSIVPSGLGGVTSVAGGGSHTVALKNDGTVVAWGKNESGQTNVPAGLSGVMAIAAGGSHTVALKSDGTVIVWGNNSDAQTTVPAGLSGVTAIAAGQLHTAALKSDGTVLAWGNNEYGQTTVPAGLSGVTAITAGGYHTVAVKSDGTVMAWGGINSNQTNVPAGLSGVTAITAGSAHTVALKSDGTVVAWGNNDYGETKVPFGLSGVTAIAAGSAHTVALKSDGTVVPWGSDNAGETTVPAGLSGVAAIAAGGFHSVAVIGDARGPVPPSVFVQPLSQTVTTGSNVTFSAAAAGSSPFSYQWRSNTVSIANATNDSFTLTNVQTSYAASYAVVITNAYGAITSSPAVLTVLLGQTITFGTLPNRTVVDAPFVVTATASSGLPVTLSVVSGPASISGNTVTLLGLGPVTLRATQAGDATCAVATPVEQTFTVAKADQTITFAPLPDKQLGDAPFSLSATASSGLAVSFSLVSGPASLSGSTLTLTNGGVVRVRAAQAGNANYNAAPNGDRVFTVSVNPPPVVTLASPGQRSSFKLGVAVALSVSAVDPQAEAVTNLTVFASNNVSGVTQIGTAAGSTFTGSWTPPAAGLYTLRAEARDSAGVLGISAEMEVRVQSLPPSVNLLSPANGTIFSLPTNLVLQAFAQDTDGFTNLVALVEFLDFGTNVVGSVANPTNTTVAFTWTNPPPGQHSLSARATDAVGYTEESSARAITVTYPAGALPVFSFAQASYTVGEAAGSATLVVVKNPSPAAAVNYTTADGTARAQDGNTLGDYTRQSGALSFTAGQLSANLVVPIVNDSGYEGDQSFTVTLSSTDPNVIVTNPAVATVIILDDDPAPTTNSVTTVLNPAALPGLGGLGSLTVSTLCTNLAGIASTNLGQWRLAWDTVWRNGGDTLTRLQPGNYDLVFQSRDGFTTPPGQTVAVSAGGTATPAVYYSATGPLQLGHLAVQLTPNTAQWRLQGETAWRASETTVSNLVAGPYVIEFNELAGYHRLPPTDTRVYSNHLGTPRYTFPANPATWNMSVVPYDRLVTVQSGEAHAFNGQLFSEGSYGTGTVVKRRVVLTAAHLVFDDRKLGFVTNVFWFHRRYAGEYEPRPQQPRGWYVFGGYDAQRAVERTPGVSQPESQIKDTAALFFFEDAGGGGQSGYLASDAGTNWLGVAADKQLTGYPLDFPAPLAQQRKLQQTPVFSSAFEQDVLRGAVRATTAFRSSGGNSGGAVCVKFNNVFYPAAIFLGGTGQSVVRLIDRDVVDLINRAEVTANTGDNNTSGGVPTDSGSGLPVPVGLGVGALAVRLPADALAVGAGWRFARTGGGADAFITDNTLTTNRIVGLSDNTLEFRTVAGFLTPGRFRAPVVTNATQVLTLVYATKLANRIQPGAGADGFRFEVSASSYGRYVVQGLVSLNGQRHLTNAPWVPLATNTLDASGRHVFTNFSGAPFQFFRTVYLTEP